jgi:hypothetical protein
MENVYVKVNRLVRFRDTMRRDKVLLRASAGVCDAKHRQTGTLHRCEAHSIRRLASRRMRTLLTRVEHGRMENPHAAFGVPIRTGYVAC